MIGGRRKRLGQDISDPEQIFKRAREVEVNLRTALAIFREHLDELEEAIHQPHEEEV